MFTGMKVTPITIAAALSDRGGGGLRQFLYTVLSRGEGQHCGRPASHRMNSFVYAFVSFVVLSI